ncbi:MAG TPA: phosphate ABC transporter permease PstA [Terriglobales bacterium]|nr:phosphate ABC transporter permease PstA [Terriglobales bacterium]
MMTPAPAADRRRLRRRHWRSRFMLALTAAATALILAPLFLILYYVAREGAAALTPAFFLQTPRPVGMPGGGMANAIGGTLELLAIAILAGVPLGLIGGIYVAEFRRERFASGVRFAADVLNGTPTIVVGLFIYAVVVVPMRRFSALAGGLALAVIMIPVVLRAAEEVLRGVPKGYRDAALALGASRWRMVAGVVLPSARVGLVSGALLGVARVAGETAPLLFTAFNNSFWSGYIDQPISSLTVQIYDYAISPYASWHAQAWAASLTLIAIIVGIGAAARLTFARRRKGMA